MLGETGIVGGTDFYLMTCIWYQMPHFKCKQNISCQNENRVLSKDQAHRAWLMFRSYFFSVNSCQSLEFMKAKKRALIRFACPRGIYMAKRFKILLQQLQKHGIW